MKNEESFTLIITAYTPGQHKSYSPTLHFYFLFLCKNIPSMYVHVPFFEYILGSNHRKQERVGVQLWASHSWFLCWAAPYFQEAPAPTLTEGTACSKRSVVTGYQTATTGSIYWSFFPRRGCLELSLHQLEDKPAGSQAPRVQEVIE